MFVKLNDATSLEIQYDSFIHSVSEEDNVYKDYDELSEKEQLAYDSFSGDVERAYRRLFSSLSQGLTA